MRLAYQAWRVLSSDWTDELHEATNDLKVRAFERELARVSKNDVPIAVRMMKKAELFTLVVDEPPEGELPEPLGPFETIEQRIQRVAHPARVGVWELDTGKQLVRLRARADGEFVPVGSQHVAHVPDEARSEDERRSVAAQQRQANSCALALAVKDSIQKRQGAVQKSRESSAGGAGAGGGGAEAGGADAGGASP
jgi:hypothetical protein